MRKQENKSKEQNGNRINNSFNLHNLLSVLNTQSIHPRNIENLQTSKKKRGLYLGKILDEDRIKTKGISQKESLSTAPAAPKGLGGVSHDSAENSQLALDIHGNTFIVTHTGVIRL